MTKKNHFGFWLIILGLIHLMLTLIFEGQFGIDMAWYWFIISLTTIFIGIYLYE